MSNDFSLKKFFVRLLIIIPLIYIGFGWWIGVNYGQKSVIFGPYADKIPDGLLILSNETNLALEVETSYKTKEADER